MPVVTFDKFADAPVSPEKSGGVVTFDKFAEPPKSAGVAATPDTRLERFGSGLADPIHGLTQMLYHLAPESVTKNVNDFNNWLADKGVPVARIPEGGLDVLERNREAAIEQTGPGKGKIDWARLAGNVASPVNFVPAASMGKAVTGAERIGQALTSGAFGGAAQPVTEGDFLKEKAKQVAGGAIGGGVIGAGTEAVGRAIAPRFAPDVEALLGLGVKLTPGQMAGGVGKKAEDVLAGVPILGSFIKGSQGRSVDSFNRAAIDLALDPIGVKLPKTMELGRTAIDYANKKLGEAYDRLLPNTVFRADPVFNTELSNLRTLVTELPKDQARQFEAIFENRVQKRLDPNGVMLGDTMKQVESELGKISRDYGSSADAAQRQLGSAVDEIRNLLRQNLQRNNPDQAAELEAINSAYARFVRVQAASSRRANTGGVFTPNDLSNAVRQTDTSVRKGRYARGNALMQDLSDPASAVLPQKVPDSGTAGRLAAMSALGLGAESGALSPYQIAAALGLAAPYTEMGSNVLNQWARAAPASRAVVRGGLETAAPYVSAPAGVVGGEVAENAGRRR